MARKADDYIDDMIYVWKGNFISFQMTYHVSLYLLCVQSYRQKSDVGALTAIFQNGHNIYKIIFKLKFFPTVPSIEDTCTHLPNFKVIRVQNPRWRLFFKMAAIFFSLFSFMAREADNYIDDMIYI